MRDIKGFSLIELLIVITVVGLLSAIAVASYSNYSQRSKMAEVRTLINGAFTKVLSMRDAGKSGIEVLDGGKYINTITINTTNLDAPSITLVFNQSSDLDPAFLASAVTVRYFPQANPTTGVVTLGACSITNVSHTGSPSDYNIVRQYFTDCT